jgi:hypothetical protein
LGGEILIWKDFYKSLLIIHGKLPVKDTKKALANKLDKLEKKV